MVWTRCKEREEEGQEYEIEARGRTKTLRTSPCWRVCALGVGVSYVAVE